MRQWKATAWVLVIAMSLVVSASACGGSSPEGQRAHGIVKSVDAGARKVTLDHQDIPGIMKGMTMTFEVAPGVELRGIAPGAEVDFRVKEEGGVYTVTEIRSSGS